MQENTAITLVRNEATRLAVVSHVTSLDQSKTNLRFQIFPLLFVGIPSFLWHHAQELRPFRDAASVRRPPGTCYNDEAVLDHS